ncbi:MAG: SurA N-terminal domain-containing protein [Bacteroidaceae bacterium]|nr:SurA N-terminal domain-containing protein [Bacteroidaceae bacterium]
MAVLQSIRSHGKLMLIIIGGALLCFIAEVVFEALGKKDITVAEVNGEKLSPDTYKAMVDEFSNVIKMQSGGQELNEEQRAQLEDQVWQTYVTNVLMEKECAKLGLRVSDKELQDIINEGTHPLLSQTPFMDQNGMFDKEQLKKFLADYEKMGQQAPELRESYEQIHAYWVYIEKQLRQSTLAQKYQALLQQSFISNPISAKANFAERTNSSDIVLAAVPYMSVADSTVAVTDADIKKVYEEKKELFRQSVETRNIKYIDVMVTASQADKDQLMSDMSQFAEELSNTADLSTTVRNAGSNMLYSGLAVSKRALPLDIINELDSTAAGSVVKPYYNPLDNTYTTFKYIEKVSMPDSVEYQQLQIAADKADSVYTALKGGAAFEEMAKKYAQPEASTWLTGSMYEQSAGQLNAQTIELVNKLTKSETGSVEKIDMNGGSLIVKIKTRKAFTDKYNLAIIKKTLEFSQDTYRDAYNNFSSFLAANKTLADLEKNAEEKGYKLLSAEGIANNAHNIANIRDTHEALRWLFNDAKKGEVSQLYECGNSDHMMVLALTGVNPAGYLPMEAIQNELRAEAIRLKKADMIAEKMASVKSIDQAKAMKEYNVITDSIKHVSFNAPAAVMMTGASEPALSGKVAGVAKGQFAGPVKGNGGVYVFQVYNTEKSEEQYDEKSEMQMLGMTAMQNSMRVVMSELMMNSKIEDNRYMYF